MYRVDRFMGEEPFAEAFTRDGDLMVILTRPNHVHLVSKDGLQSIYSEFKEPLHATAVAFNGDESLLACVHEGKLELLETARWRKDPLRERAVQRYVEPAAAR